MNLKNRSGWAAEEFAEVNLGDKRLDTRLIKLCDRFSDAPECKHRLRSLPNSSV